MSLIRWPYGYVLRTNMTPFPSNRRSIQSPEFAMAEAPVPEAACGQSLRFPTMPSRMRGPRHPFTDREAWRWNGREARKASLGCGAYLCMVPAFQAAYVALWAPGWYSSCLPAARSVHDLPFGPGL